MKNQYFGDINDYRKYGILRILSSQGKFKIGVCWMLTSGDNSNDGQFTNYFDNSELRKHDPALFDSLKSLFEAGKRQVSQAALPSILPETLFFTDLLCDEVANRESYFKKMIEKFSSVDLIFFDPDNGLEVKSTKYGAKDSSKYLYWREAVEAYDKGHSLLIYQHFPRIEHSTYIMEKCQEIHQHISTVDVYALKTSTVVYFLIPQKDHGNCLNPALDEIQEQWEKQIEVIRNEGGSI